ncbi:MAG: isochorismatase [Anaerolineales bacterium]
MPLPIPLHYDPQSVANVYRVPYAQRAVEAKQWARQHGLRPAAEDAVRIALLLIDVQNTFCLPDFELYVSGRTGTGVVDDNQRLVEFIYRNLGHITHIVATLDTHQAAQVFHPTFLINAAGQHPAPHTQITAEDIERGVWWFNPALAETLGVNVEYAQRHLLHYTRTLQRGGQYALTVWPYHAMLGGIGHALVSAVEEAVFFHSLARSAQPDFQLKGFEPLTEHYSALGPEVLADADGQPLGEQNTSLIHQLLSFDAVIVAGQAKSHCVAWTVQHLLDDIRLHDPALAQKVYLLEDCTSPVVVPGVVDFTEQADAAYQRFADAGMHRVRAANFDLESLIAKEG